ncbi:MAG: SRPBCC domain-containing protein [Verrucomicrobiota bacterium]
MKLPIAVIALCSLTSIVRAEEVVYVQEIRTSAKPASVWEALTKPEIVRTYHMTPLQKIELKKGGEITYGRGDKVMISGSITEIEPNMKLAHTFHFGPGKPPGTEADADTLVTYTIRIEGAETVLKLTHSGFTERNQTYANATGGWPFVLKKLKLALQAKPAP